MNASIFPIPLAILGVAWPIHLAAGQQPGKPQGEPVAISLTEAQKQALQEVGKEFESKVQGVALKLAQIAKDYDRNLLSDNPDLELERKLGDELAETVSRIVSEAIRYRLASVRNMVKLLTPEQKALLSSELSKPDTNPDLIELMKKVLADKKKK